MKAGPPCGWRRCPGHRDSDRLFGVALYLDQAVWRDLSDVMSASGKSMDIFHEATHRAARAVNYYGPESQAVVGIPAGIFTHAVAYNRELFAKARIPEPPHRDDPAWTYARQLEVAKALTVDRTGKTADMSCFDPIEGRAIRARPLGHGMQIRGFGGSVYDAETRRISIADGPYVESVQFGADLVNVHHVLANDELAAGVAAGASDRLGGDRLPDGAVRDSDGWPAGKQVKEAGWPPAPSMPGVIPPILEACPQRSRSSIRASCATKRAECTTC